MTRGPLYRLLPAVGLHRRDLFRIAPADRGSYKYW